ncbi:MAG: hypothetical protein ACNA77_00920 [Opitutales bacterium]
MDAFKDLIFSGNIVGWIILIVLLIIFIKLLKSVGKGMFLFAAFCLGVFLIAKFFPGIAEPITDFVRGGWLGDQRPD